jgi:hypothetical protein
MLALHSLRSSHLQVKASISPRAKEILDSVRVSPDSVINDFRAGNWAGQQKDPEAVREFEDGQPIHLFYRPKAGELPLLFRASLDVKSRTLSVTISLYSLEELSLPYVLDLRNLGIGKDF